MPNFCAESRHSKEMLSDYEYINSNMPYIKMLQIARKDS